MRPALTAAVCALLASGWLIRPGRAAQAPQQSPAGQPARPSFRVSVTLVQVDAIVTDAQGNHVSGLRANDFEVTEDGKPQRITNFSWVDLRPAASSPTGVSEPARTPRADRIRRSLVLMIDDSGPWAEEDVLPVISAARQFVAEQVAPGDLVSVTASRGGMGFYQQLTSDRAQLNAAIEHIAQRPGFGQWTVALPVVATADGQLVPIS